MNRVTSLAVELMGNAELTDCSVYRTYVASGPEKEEPADGHNTHEHIQGTTGTSLSLSPGSLSSCWFI